MPPKTTHIDRTAYLPRDTSLHELLITSINPITPNIRLVRLSYPAPPHKPIYFLPGQWLDLYHPPFSSSQSPGGFTITSPPSITALSPQSPYHLELAIQLSPSNPPAAYLWQDPPSLINTPVRIRTGGNFTYPPLSSLDTDDSLKDTGCPAPLPFKKVIFVAGGVGINPIMSMLSHISTFPVASEKREKEVVLLYGMRDPDGRIQRGDTSQALFLDRIAGLFAGNDDGGLKGGVKLFLTGGAREDSEVGSENQLIQDHGVRLPFVKRRISLSDLAEAIGEDKDEVAVYICGVPPMTDELVAGLISPTPKGLGMDERRVLYEKWW